jgi:hypothetical protein
MTRLLRNGLVAGAALALIFSSSALLARQGVLKTREGKTLEGDIEESPDKVVITLHGIKTTIDRQNIDGQVEYFDNVEARYKAKVAALPKKPVAADRLALARWLFDIKAYDLALGEIDEAKKLDANSAEAQTLEQTIMSQRRIEKNHAAAGTGTTPNPNPGPAPVTPAGTKPPAGEKKFLSAEDINVIRQTEWRKDDQTVPRVTVPVDIRKKYVNMKALDPGEFAAKPMPEQAYFILTDPDATPEMKHDIKITTDPQALAEYRRVIQPLVINNCATTGCHGGKAAGRFFLFNTNTDREEVAFTNFYILQWYQQTYEGDKVYSMVDRTYPDRSILAQYALLPDSAELKHPEIKGQTYKPIAANKTAVGYKTITAWMKALQAQDPNSPAAKDGSHTAYRINYDPPTSSPKKPPEAVPDNAPKTDAPKTDAPKTAAPPVGTVPPPAKTGAGAANK